MNGTHILIIAPNADGKADDFRNTSRYTQVKNGEILTKPEDTIENSRVRPQVLGDGAYPLLPLLMKPFNFGLALTHSD